VGMRLGCLNHALLTTGAIAARGLKLAGWVANDIDPEMAVAAENVRALEQRIDAPLLGHVVHAAIPDSRTIASQLDIVHLTRLVGADGVAGRDARALNGRTRSVRTRAIKTARKRPF